VGAIKTALIQSWRLIMAKLIYFIERHELAFWIIFSIAFLVAFDHLTNGSEKREIRAKYQQAHGLCEMFAASRTVDDYRQCYEKWGKPVEK
jgi:hypothetical protein